MIEKSGSESKKTSKKNDVSVSCWNCFLVENDNDSYKEVPLSEIRKEYRQNFKLYSVFASEISRPKVVPIKQKVKENYAVGKKIEKKIINKCKEEKHTESLEDETAEDNDNELPETCNNKVTFESNAEIQKSQVHEIKNDCAVSKKIENTYLPETESEVERIDANTEVKTKRETSDDHVVSNKTISEEKVKKLIHSPKERSVATKYHTECLKDKKQLETIASTINVQTVNKRNPNESCSVDKINTNDGKSRKPVNSLKKETPEHIKYYYDSLETSNDEDTLDSNIQTQMLNDQKLKEECTVDNEVVNKINNTNCNTDTKETGSVEETPDKVTSNKEATNEKKVVDTNTDTQASCAEQILKKSCILEKEQLPNLQNKDDANFKQCKNEPLEKEVTVKDEDSRILYKVQIETSTPNKESKQIDCDYSPLATEDEKPKGEEIENIILGIQNLSILENEDKSATVDKTDNLSSSESGYDGSSLRDINDLENVKKSTPLKSPNRNKSFIPVPIRTLSKKEDCQTSLPALNVMQRRNILKSTKSLCGDTSDGAVKPVKSLRWSTLDLPHRSTSVTDEVYMADPASPNHATLPRRSNSPLPHERDLLDRDRFSLNRSGLQTRSESMASVYSGAGEGTRGNVTVRGEVQISLLYNYRLGALEVGVKRCRELAPVDVKRNRSDPYVKVYLLPDKSKAGKRKTKVKKNTLNPVFEESLSFVQPLASLSARTLWLSVWHADMFGRNDFLGEVTLPLADVVFDDPAPMWYKLHERTEQFDEQQGSRGDLVLALKLELSDPAHPARAKGTLHVLVKEAKNLVATKPNGLADVFCKSYLLPERGRLAKQKTAVCRRTLNPKWEHTFTYRGLSLQELSTRALELSLWDRDRLASNDFMGAVRLSLGTGTYMGAPVNWMDSVGKEVSLWQMMLHRPNFWVEGSFPLRPHLNN